MADVLLREILPQLGFEEDWTLIADRQPSFAHSFDGTRIIATEIMGGSFKPVTAFWGLKASRKTIGEVSFEAPILVESFEQGVAWVTYCLDKVFHPPLDSPEWLLRGRQWAEHLPWVRRQLSYEARPRCLVERDWMKVARRRLREASDRNSSQAIIAVSFDGTVMRLTGSGTEVVLPAAGIAWPTPYSVMMTDLLEVTRRLTQPAVEIGVWDDRLQVGNRSVALAKDD